MKCKIFLVLTFYIFINITQGKQGFGPSDQEWGYVVVRPKAHMFWWLYYTTADVNSNYEKKPLIIWLDGGPGVSGTAFGNFEELGPLDVDLNPRNHTLVKDYNVLFIDNPVGTGFSYVESIDLLSKNNKLIVLDLMQCMQKFYQQFPKFAKTPTYIVGESYGGKITVEFAYLWHQEQIKGNIKSNLKGIGLADALISTNEMYASIAPYMYNFGLVDRDGKRAISDAADEFVKASEAENWLKAMEISEVIENLMQNFAHHVDRYNVLKKVGPARRSFILGKNKTDTEVYSQKLKDLMKKVRVVMDLKSEWGVQEDDVFDALLEDCRKPVVDYVEKLLNDTDIKVFVFNGQLDLIVNIPGTLSWIEKLKWMHAEKWLKAPRSALIINNIIEGYYKGYGNLKFYWVNRSGHMVAADNPPALAYIIKDLTCSAEYI